MVTAPQGGGGGVCQRMCNSCCFYPPRVHVRLTKFFQLSTGENKYIMCFPFVVMSRKEEGKRCVCPPLRP